MNIHADLHESKEILLKLCETTGIVLNPPPRRIQSSPERVTSIIHPIVDEKETSEKINVSISKGDRWPPDMLSCKNDISIKEASR